MQMVGDLLPSLLTPHQRVVNGDGVRMGVHGKHGGPEKRKLGGVREEIYNWAFVCFLPGQTKYNSLLP